MTMNLVEEIDRGNVIVNKIKWNNDGISKFQK